MKRLNAALRDAIVDNALTSSGIIQKDRDLIDARATFAEKVRKLCLKNAGTSDTELHLNTKAAVELRVAGYLGISISLPGNSHFDVNLCGQRHRMILNGARQQMSKTHIEIVGVYDGGPFVPLTGVPNIADTALLHEWNVLLKRQEVNDANRQELVATVSAVLAKCRTVEQLVKLWPAATELLPDDEVAIVTGTDVALSIDTLNAICGIPAGDKKCCEPTADELRMLAEGDYSPEELWGVGGKKTCPKCEGKS